MLLYDSYDTFTFMVILLFIYFILILFIVIIMYNFTNKLPPNTNNSSHFANLHSSKCVSCIPQPTRLKSKIGHTYFNF